MYKQEDIRQLFLKNKHVRTQWKELLTQCGIERIFIDDYSQLDKVLGLYIHDKLVGTVSYQGNIIKYIAISKNYKESGSTFNLLLSYIIKEMSYQNIFHFFVFTKCQYQKSFESLGFNTIVTTDKTSILEMGNWSIDQYLDSIPKKENIKITSVIMNANPFTLGHYYLVKQASLVNDLVYVFILKKEQSLFSTTERISLVKKGLKKIKNVIIISGDDYVISPATFPTYFLRKDDEIAKEQMLVDVKIFKEKIAPYLNIKSRYVGEEPLSPMTNSYNRMLKNIMPPEIEVKIISRKKTIYNQIISASKVREAYLNNQLETVKEMLPKTTYLYLKHEKGRTKLWK